MRAATPSDRLPKAAIGVATGAMVLGAFLAPSGWSPGQTFFLLGIFWTGGAIAAAAIVAVHRMSARPAPPLRGVPLAATVISGGVFLMGLVAWAALATWGCLFNPHAPWSCPLGN